MRAHLQTILRRALAEIDGVPADFEPQISIPQDQAHGDYATNAALQLARHLKQNPRSIAASIIERLKSDSQQDGLVERYAMAGPGFINFYISTSWWHRVLEEVIDRGSAYGRMQSHAGERALVEFVSANPTGPLTVGHGRNAVLGDTIARLLEHVGYEVTREYYFNDAGRQMRVLGASVRARCAELSGRTDILFPEEGYVGDYIADIAGTVLEAQGVAILDSADLEPFIQAAKERIFSDISQTLERLRISMDTFFNEGSLYTNGAIDDTLERLGAHTYQKDGAVWLQTSRMGKETDTVLVKSTGEPTYRLPDIAYHRDKFGRGYDVMVNIFGADHIATYPDIMRALNVLGHDTDRLDVIIHQFVTLMEGGKEVKMSTRKARYVTLNELMDAVGEDATRYFFLMRSAGRHLEFDMDLAKEASDKNPVFYLQYAHARICSILRKAEESGFALSEEPDASCLTQEEELRLIQALALFSECISKSAAAREPHRIGTYLRSLAEAFSRFYHECRIIGEEHQLASARMALARATRIVLRSGLSVLGVTAPERM